jgi:hypothetical protein
MSRVTERRFKQEYSFKGVTKAPDAYASEIMQGLRRSYVNAAISAPFVRIAQFGDIIERGKGTEWRIDYTQRDYSMAVLQDVQTGGGTKWGKGPFGTKIPIGIEPRVRVVRFTIDLIVVETLSKDTVPMAVTQSDEEVNTDEIAKAFEEMVKSISVTTETSVVANETVG